LALPLLFLMVLMVCLQTPMATAVSIPPLPAELLWMDKEGTYDIALSKDGQYVAAVGPIEVSTELRFYNRSSGDPIWTYYAPGDFYSVAISADGSCVAAGNGSHVFFWMNAKSRTPGNTDPTWTSVDLGGPIEYRCLAISDDGNYVVAGGTGPTVYYWANAKGRTGSSQAVTWQKGGFVDVWAVDMSSDGNYVVAGVATKVAYWKDAATSRHIIDSTEDWLSPNLIDVVVDVAVSDDGNYVAAAATTDTVYYWAGARDLPANPPPTWSSGAGIYFTSIDMSSDGDKVIAGALGPPEDQGVYFWSGARTRSGTPPWSWNYTTAGGVCDVAINDAGDYMAAANSVIIPHCVYFFDSSGNSLWNPPYQVDDMVKALSISSDGGTLAIGTIPTRSRYLVSTGFKTLPPQAVGGHLIAVDKLALLSPWIAVAFAALAVTVFATRRRKT